MKAIKLFVLMGSLIGLVGFAGAGTDTGCSNCSYTSIYISTNSVGHADIRYCGNGTWSSGSNTTTANSISSVSYNNPNDSNLDFSFDTSSRPPQTVILDSSCSIPRVTYETTSQHGYPEFNIAVQDNESATFNMTYDGGTNTVSCQFNTILNLTRN